MLRIGVPSKGRLMEETQGWFAARGVTLRLTGGERGYAGAVEGVEGVALVLMAASEVPRDLASGRIHLGVTGSDLVRDRLAAWERTVAVLAPMGFGRADLTIAVPEGWIDVETLDDLDAVAHDFRAAQGFRLRIATKYHRLVREFLTLHGVADYQLIDSQGATEATVLNGAAEAIADITSSGATLRANGLRPLADGLIHASEATLYAAREAGWDEAAREAMAALCAQMGLAVPEGLGG